MIKPEMLCPKAVERYNGQERPFDDEGLNDALMSHNEIPVSRRLAKDWFRLSVWMVCIACDNYRRVKR